MSERDNTVGNEGRRNFLIASTSVVSGIGVAFAAVPFLASWQPSARAKASGAPVKIDLDKLQPGQMAVIEWRGKPVYIVHRTEQQLAELSSSSIRNKLSDPDSEHPQQPQYIAGDARALRPKFLVLIGLCTHLGCAPKFRPQTASEDLGKDWTGGFFCPCHGSRFDLSGRVWSGMPASPTNLEIPPYSFEDGNLLVVGIDPTDDVGAKS